MDLASYFQQLRLQFKPRLPLLLEKPHEISFTEYPKLYENRPQHEEILLRFPHIAANPCIAFKADTGTLLQTLRVGVLFSGGPAPGGHNVVWGILDTLKKLSPHSQLIGFLNGTEGLTHNRWMILSQELMSTYHNMGGFDMLGSSRTKIETEEQLEKAFVAIEEIGLHGLIVVGGDDSNTNAAILAEYSARKGKDFSVIGVPKTIDGDLKNPLLEISFGYDTACKTYAALISNLARDSLSVKKYYHFVRLMGRSASHVTLECALRTHPTWALFSEEVRERKLTLDAVADQLTDLIIQRASKGKHYGVILIPEGLIEAVLDKEVIMKAAAETRDSHDNLRVAAIETERVLIQMVHKKLQHAAQKGLYRGEFEAVPHFFGYEGRSAFPSNFDAHYGYALGATATVLVHKRVTGYMASLTGTYKPPEEWTPVGIPFSQLMALEMRKGVLKPVIEKAFVNLHGPVFQKYLKKRTEWSLDDHFCFVPPIQYFGPELLTEERAISLQIEFSNNSH